MLWRLWTLFPHAFPGGLSDEDLTEEQWIWFQCQMLLDDGITACAQCEALGQGPYCHACGGRMVPELQTCAQCQMAGTGAYCRHCGTPLESAVGAAIDRGTFDWDAWARSLTPFLGGLTAREATLLGQDGERMPT
jgi:hypothetical protein